MSQRPATPPYHPTYGVRLSDTQIRNIVSEVFPGRTLVKSEQLESGKSFNNRVYFIEVERDSTTDAKSEEYVLRVVGHFWNGVKLQNEVGSLLLLEEYCPKVPVPRVVAWSNEGRTVITVDGNQASLASSDNPPRPWIMTTRLPGRIIEPKDLEGAQGKSVVRDLAAHMADWRSNMPRPSHFGNIRSREKADTPQSTTLFKAPSQNQRDFAMGGLILCGIVPSEPLKSALEFYTYFAEDRLEELNRGKVLDPLAARIRDEVVTFIERDLPKLPLFQNREETSTFTHLDFAPRNILVAGDDHLEVTGILDWEWAGFSPWEDEFINFLVRQPDDWEAKFCQILLKELGMEKLLQKPLPSARQSHAPGEVLDEFEQLCVLAEVTLKIAPWYIHEGSMSDSELQEEIDVASETVLGGIEKLRSCINDP